MRDENLIFVLKLIPILFASLLTLGSSCTQLIPPATAPPNARTLFKPEYDRQFGYNLFDQGTAKVENTYAPCGTDVSIQFDEVITPVQVIHYDSVGFYMNAHAQISNGQFDFKAYLLAIKDASNKPPPPPPGIEILARTYDHGSGFAWAVIYVDAIKRNYPFPDDQPMIDKVTIHEMGHMRVNLTHLCDALTGQIMTADHDDSSCVMGSGKISTCTNKDLTVNPHFCPADCERLKKVKW